MDLNRIALFVKVVETGGFTAAAAELGLPKSSVSRSVSLLEDELGVRLLHRTTRSITLTEAGQHYFDAVSASITGLKTATQAALEHGVEPRGVVRITAPPDVAGLDELVAQWVRLHPLVRLEVAVTSRTVDLVAEGFDLAIRAARLSDSSLIARRVGNAVLAIMASPAYLRRRGTPKTLEDLREHDWVLYRANDGHSTLTLTHTDGSEHAIDVVGTVVIDDMTLCRRAVLAGAGLGLLPVHTTADALRDGQLQLVLPAYQNGAASISVLMASAKNVPARVALVRDFLVDGLAKHLATSTAGCVEHPVRPKRVRGA